MEFYYNWSRPNTNINLGGYNYESKVQYNYNNPPYYNNNNNNINNSSNLDYFQQSGLYSFNSYSQLPFQNEKYLNYLKNPIVSNYAKWLITQQQPYQPALSMNPYVYNGFVANTFQPLQTLQHAIMPSQSFKMIEQSSNSQIQTNGINDENKQSNYFLQQPSPNYEAYNTASRRASNSPSKMHYKDTNYLDYASMNTLGK
jgi:hypothetical protein